MHTRYIMVLNEITSQFCCISIGKHVRNVILLIFFWLKPGMLLQRMHNSVEAAVHMPDPAGAFRT